MKNKAVSTQDINNSLNDGRLLNQITIMTKYYAEVILLLEFDESIKFKLKDRYENRGDTSNVDSSSLNSKLGLLQLNFPMLTILWSKSPKETAKIFHKLKRNCGNPNLNEIANIGKIELSKSMIGSDLNNLFGEDNNAGIVTFFNYIVERLDSKSRNKLLPQDFLRGLPGITNKNLLYHFKDIKNIKELVSQPLEFFTKALGDKIGKDWHKLIHHKFEQS